MIQNINLGLCHHRTTAQKPPYFVNYTIDGQNKYAFFCLRFAAEAFKERLLKQQAQQATS
jgi:hypothetical protein